MRRIYKSITKSLKTHNRISLLLLGLFLLVISITFFGLSIDKPYMGIVLTKNERGWAVNEIDSVGLAANAGITLGDKPIEINGQPAEIFLNKYAEAGMVWGPLITELVVINDQGQTKSVAIETSSPSQQSLIEIALTFVVCLFCWVVGFYVFLKKPKNKAAILFYLCGLLVPLVLSGNIAGQRSITAAPYIEIPATIIGPWLLMHFFLILPEERAKLSNNKLIYLIYLPALVTLILFYTVDYKDGQPVMWFRSIRLLEYGAGFLASLIVVIINYICLVSFKTKQQMKIILSGCVIALLPALILNILPQAIWRQTILPPGTSILFIVFIPISMGFAIVTQKLMDIDLIIRRGVIYGSITIAMAIILSLVLILVANFQEFLSVPEEILVALALGGIASFLFGPIKKRIEALIDKLFYKDRYDYRIILQSLSISLNSINNFSDISRLVVGTIINTLNLGGGCLFIYSSATTYEIRAAQGTFVDKSKLRQLESIISNQNKSILFPNLASTVDQDLSFLIPLETGEKQIGILCLSQKISRQVFSPNDIFLLQGVASVATIALHRTMLIRDVNMRDTFVSIASHELRTPLTSIIGYADLLMHRDTPESTRKQWLQHIINNGQKLSMIVNDLLNIAKIQSGKVNIKLTSTALPDVLNEPTSLTSESTDQHNIIVKIAPYIPNVLIDRDKLTQIISNLLSNAIKYSPNGGDVIISAYHDAPNHRVVISVADNGIGISPEDRQTLFTAFHRIKRPETQGIKGSGLGLYVAKVWTEAMQCEIWLESELNKGSIFYIGIPISSKE